MCVCGRGESIYILFYFGRTISVLHSFSFTVFLRFSPFFIFISTFYFHLSSYLGIYREVYLVRKPETFICDYEFSSDITVPTEKLKKNIKKEFNELDDLFDNIDEGKKNEGNEGINGKDGKEGSGKEKVMREGKEVVRSLTAIVSVNILTEGVLNKLKNIKIKDKKVEIEGEKSAKSKGSKKNKDGKNGKEVEEVENEVEVEDGTQYAVRAELFRPNSSATSSFSTSFSTSTSVLTLTGLLKQVKTDRPI